MRNVQFAAEVVQFHGSGDDLLSARMVIERRFDLGLTRLLRICSGFLFDSVELLEQVVVSVEIVVKIVIVVGDEIVISRFGRLRRLSLRRALRDAEEVVEDGFVMRRSRRRSREGSGVTSAFGS